MNREIKFRGYNRKNSQWLYGFYLQNRGAHFVCPDEFATGKSWEDYEIDPGTLGQYTGLHDKKGNEIYEGDVIKCRSYCNREWSSLETRVVYFVDSVFAARSLTKDGGHPKLLYELHVTSVKGNIHENPEPFNTEDLPSRKVQCNGKFNVKK